MNREESAVDGCHTNYVAQTSLSSLWCSNYMQTRHTGLSSKHINATLMLLLAHTITLPIPCIDKETEIDSSPFAWANNVTEILSSCGTMGAICSGIEV